MNRSVLAWIVGVVAALASLPFVLVVGFVFLMWLSERPQSFEEKVQLKGAAVWSVGTQSESGGGDYCKMDYRLEFARTAKPREVVEIIQQSQFGACHTPNTLSRATWFGFGNGIYLRVGEELYRRSPKKRWHKQASFDGKHGWSLSRINTRFGQLFYTRAEGKRTFHRVYRLPSDADSPLILVSPSTRIRKEVASKTH